MQCNMNGAVVREHPAKPTGLTKFARDAICECNAETVNAVKTRTVGKKKYDCFEGCPFLLQGLIERAPSEWGHVEWPVIPLFIDGKSEASFVKADKLIQAPGRINKFTATGIELKESK